MYRKSFGVLLHFQSASFNLWFVRNKFQIMIQFWKTSILLQPENFHLYSECSPSNSRQLYWLTGLVSDFWRMKCWVKVNLDLFCVFWEWLFTWSRFQIQGPLIFVVLISLKKLGCIPQLQFVLFNPFHDLFPFFYLVWVCFQYQFV